MSKLNLPEVMQIEILATEAIARDSHRREFDTLSVDQFEMMSDWVTYAILSLVDTPGAKATPQFVARRLNVSPVRAARCLKVLKKLGMLTKTKDGIWKQSTAPIAADNAVSTSALRESHKLLLKKAVECLDELPMKERDFSGIILPMDMKWLPEVQKKVSAFRRKLLLDLQKKGVATEVYALTIQVFPLSKSLWRSKNENHC